MSPRDLAQESFFWQGPGKAAFDAQKVASDKHLSGVYYEIPLSHSYFAYSAPVIFIRRK
jgi:hypothetical protein